MVRDEETGAYSTLARTYFPEIGRWAQRDPNETALLHSSVLRSNAQSALLSAAASAGAQYRDGLGLYAFGGSNPVGRTDPSGLFWGYGDIWDEVGDVGAHYYADRAAAQIEVIEQARVLKDRALSMLWGMASEMVVRGVATAVHPAAPYFLSARDAYQAIHAIYEHGLSWGSAFGLAAALYDFKLSAGSVNEAMGFSARKGQKPSAGLGLDIDTGDFGAHLDDARRGYRGIRIGSFSISDWSGYPAGVPKPKGPFRLVTGDEYTAARAAADRANRKMRREMGLKGMDVDVHEIQPVKFGGSPTDPSNKVILPKSTHLQANSFWYRLQVDLESGVAP